MSDEEDKTRELAKLYRKRLHDRRAATTKRRRTLAKTPEPVGAVLQLIFQKNPEARAKIAEQEAFAAWGKYVGESAAKHSEPTQVRNKTLYVRVPNPIWRNELSFLKNDILARFREDYPQLQLQDIFFKAW